MTVETTQSNPTREPLSWEASARLRQKRLAEARALPGSNRALLEQTRILRDVIDPGVLADEPAVAETRWAQYGYVSGFDATEDFTRCFVRVYDRWIATYKSDPHRCPINPEFVLNEPGVMNALYSARQFADSLGISYPVFVSEMFARLTKVGLYRRPPLPNHLYPPRKPRKRKWRRKFTTRLGIPVQHKALRHAMHVREAMAARSVLAHDWDRRLLQARNFVDDPAQRRALKALFDHQEAGSTPQRRLRRALEDGCISVENARRYFPGAIVESVLCDVSSLPNIAEPEPGLAPYRPHCLGLYQPKAPASTCAECPWQPKCQALATWAERQQVALTGYANRREREAMEALGRKRNERKRKKDGAKTPPSDGASE